MANKKAFLGVGGKPRFPQPDQQKHIDSVSKNIAILTGQTKNTKDRAVLFRDLQDFGLVDKRGKFVGFSSGDNGGSDSGNDGGSPVNPRAEIPHKPENVRAVPGFTTVMIKWDFPSYAGHDYAEVYRNTIDALGDMTDPRTEGEAVKIATSSDSMYLDSVEHDTEYYYWVRFVNTNGSVGPVQSASGVYAKTRKDPLQEIADFAQESADTLNTFQESFNGQLNLLDDAIGDFRAEVLTSENELTEAFTAKLEYAITGPDGAIAGEIANYGVEYGGNTYSIAEGIQASVDLDGVYQTQWGVQTQVGDLQHGVGFIDDNGTTTFMVSADSFAVFNPVDGQWEAIFGVTDGKVIIKEAVMGDAVINTLTVAFSATFENEVFVNGTLDAWKLKGAQITGNALWMVNGNHSLAIEPDDFLAFWYGEAVYYNVETDTDNRSLGNAKFALMNNGRVLARGMELYDNDNNLLMDVDGLDGTYIKDLTVDTLKIKANAVTVPLFIESEEVITDRVYATLLDYEYTQDFSSNVVANFNIVASREQDGNGRSDAVTILMNLYHNNTNVETVLLYEIYADSGGGDDYSFSIPITAAAHMTEGTVRVLISVRGKETNSMFKFKAQGTILNAKR